MVDYSELHVTRTTTVDASPDAVYDIVADVTRIGELSPGLQSGVVGRGGGTRARRCTPSRHLVHRSQRDARS